MKKTIIIATLFCSLLSSQSSDWDSQDNQFEDEHENSNFEKMKIKSRSKKEYDDKIYKYIKGDYTVKNNTIELATIELDDNARNKNVEINVHVEDLEVIGDEYKDSISLKRNQYKNFVQHDEKGGAFFEEEIESFNNDTIEGNAIQSQQRIQDRRREKIIDKDISELETIDLRGNNKIKEINVFIEDTRIRVDN